VKKLLILLPMLLAAFAAYSADVTKLNPDSSKQCAVCHYEWMPEFLFDLKGTELVDYQKEKTVATEKMCFSCHNGTVGDSRIRIWSGDMHKLSDKIPEHMNIPKELPLNGNSIGCRTCHSAHSTGNPEKEGVEKSVFLRMENEDSQLCQACHTDMSKDKVHSHPLKEMKKADKIEPKLKKMFGKLGSKNQVVCESCHTPHSPKENKLLISELTDSKLCSVCHEDKVNPDSLTYVKGVLNHPINVIQEKPAADIEKHGGKYGKGGEVICLTCHAPHNGKNKGLLIESNQDSKLCLTCHNEKKSVVETKHDMKTVKGYRTKDGRTAQETGTCESCHAPHGWAVKLPKGEGDLISKSCLSCHDDGGVAEKKVISSKLFNHPVGKSIKDGVKAPENLPLYGRLLNFLTEFRTDGEVKKTVTCATCHDVHSKGQNFLRTEAATGALCISCHNEKEMIQKTLHGGQKLEKNCLSCHKVHNSDNERLLIKGENDGCLTCHKEGEIGQKMLTGEHSHPVNIAVDRKLDEHFKLSKDNKMTCVSCHDPHSSTKTAKLDRDFIRGGFADKDQFCTACHEGQKEIIGSDHDVRKKDSEEVCSQCHAVHKAKTDKNIMALEYTYNTEDDSCKVCHSEKGSADKKIVMDGHKLGKTEMHEKYGKFLTEKDGDYYIYCSSCHTVHNNGPKKGEEGTIRNSFLNKKLSENGSFCAGCHEDKKSFAASKHNVNSFENHSDKTAKAKAEGDTCGSCHIVHNSGEYLFAKEYGGNFEKMCESCHAKGEAASKTAIETSHKMNMKPEKADGLYLQNGNVVCATCHEPHAENRGMLRDLGDKNICAACHKDKDMVELSEHNLAKLDYIDGEIKATAGVNPCYTCHKPHNFHKGNKYMWAFEMKDKRGFAYDVCSSCHADKGIGYKKVPEAQVHARIFKIFPYKERFKEYLFDEKGEVSTDGAITCQTCHDPHVWVQGMTKPEINVEGDVKNSFLKLSVKDDFCQVCHGEKQSEDLFNKYHDQKFRDAMNKKDNEAEVMKNILMIQMNLEKYKEEKK
jgi:predicted CXXCH cytochrome family protein